MSTAIGGFHQAIIPIRDVPCILPIHETVTALTDLWRSDLDGLSDEQLINRLDRLLYGAQGGQLLEDDDQTVFECEHDWKEYGTFNCLTNWGVQFDREGKAFIFCPPGQP